MLSRRMKSLYYCIASPLLWINGIVYRYFKATHIGMGLRVRVHLGPGQNNYLKDWINLDANMFTAKCDVWVDLRNPLPFNNASVDAFYSHHVVEHLPELRNHFIEVFRCLKPGGVYRVGVPNADAAIRKFLENDQSWFPDFPDSRQSIGGRLDNFILCRNEHLAILTTSYLEEIMGDIGYVNMKKCLPVIETSFPNHFDSACLGTEHENNYEAPHTLIVEAQKPGA